MNHILSESLKVIHSNQSLIEIEMALETYFTNTLSELFSQALSQIDLELIQDYKDDGYVIDRVEKRTIHFF